MIREPRLSDMVISLGDIVAPKSRLNKQITSRECKTSCFVPYGTLTSFDPPEGKQTKATSINDGGAIAGYYRYNAGGGPPATFIRVP